MLSPYGRSMIAPARPALRPIVEDDLGAIGSFLHRNLNSRVSAAGWSSALKVPWAVDAPNYGFQLVVAHRIVGAYLGFYSDRLIDGSLERFCNLGAWCVLEEYRAEGLRLLRAMLGQRGYHFTDLSPSGNVLGLNERLRFTRVDSPIALVPALPWPSPRGIRVSSSSVDLDRLLDEDAARIYRDHRDTAAARHVVIARGAESCYVVFRRDRRKGIPGFATILYVSDPTLFRAALRPFASHLLLRHRLPGLLVEDRVVGGPLRGSAHLARLRRPKMLRSERVRPDQIDYLYSELTCVAW